MYAICFDLDTNKLKKLDDYPNLYNEINRVLGKLKFNNTQGSVYINDNDDLALLYQAITELKEIENFNQSVRDIRAFKVESYSNFNSFFDNSKD